MKKMLISLVWCGTAVFSHAMDCNGYVPKELYTSDACIEYDVRQRFKDSSYHDVAYATIPEAESTLDMNNKDPFGVRTFKELKKNRTVIARVVTEKKTYYCQMRGLHEKLGLSVDLPSLSMLKDPLDNDAALRAIDYYVDMGCARCKKCDHMEYEFKQGMKESLRDATKEPEMNAEGCDNGVMTHIGCYKDLQDLIHALGKDKDLMLPPTPVIEEYLKDAGIMLTSKSISIQETQENRESSNILVKLVAGVPNVSKHLARAAKEYDKGNYNQSIIECVHAKNSMRALEESIRKHDGAEDYRKVRTCRLILTGLKVYLAIGEIGAKGALITDHAAREAYWAQSVKEQAERL